MKKPDSDGSQQRVAQQRAVRRRPGSDIHPSSSSDGGGEAGVGGGLCGLYYSDDVLGRGCGCGGDGEVGRTWGHPLGLVLVREIRSSVVVFGRWMGQAAVAVVEAVMTVLAALVRAFASVRYLSRLRGRIGLDVVGEGVVLRFGSDLEVGVENGVELATDRRSLGIVLVEGG